MHKEELIKQLTVRPKKIKELSQLAKELDRVMEGLNFEKIGALFNYKGPEVEFLKSQILVNGLEYFSLSIEANASDYKKRTAVVEMIRIWDKKGYSITNL